MKKVAAALALLFVLISSQASHAQITIGNCNIVSSSAAITREQLPIIVEDFGCPQDPRKVLRVAYYWLDTTTLAFLLSGQNDTRLRALVGERPIVVGNEVLTELRLLTRRFGSNIDAFPEGERGFNVNVMSQSRQHTVEPPVGAPRARTIAAYAGDGMIYYPDFVAISAAYNSLQWPQGYRLYFSESQNDDPILTHGSPEVDAASLFNSTVIWKYLQKSDIEQYSSKIEEVRTSFTANWRDFYFPGRMSNLLDPTDREQQALSARGDYQAAYTQLQITKLPNLRLNRSISAMLYFGSNNWPADFLPAYGVMDSHGGASMGWSVVAPARKLFALVAVVENMGGSGASFSLDGFNVRSSERVDLRSASQERSDKVETIPFAPRNIARGDKVVIPLGIELRDNATLDIGPGLDISPSNDRARNSVRALARYRDDQVLKTDLNGRAFRKTKRAFSMIEKPQTTGTYYFGRRYTFESMVIDGKNLPVRRLDPSVVTMVAGLDGGSCPVLYIMRKGVSEPLRYGTVLRKARGFRELQTEEIDLGDGAIGFELAEEEPERSTIKSVRILLVSSDGKRRDVFETAGAMALHEGEKLVVNLEDAPVGSRYVVQLTGFYQTYADMIAAR